MRTWTWWVMAGGGLALVWLVGGCSRGDANLGGEEKLVPVTVAVVMERVFEERLEVDGAVEAKTTAMVTPRVPGPIERLFAREGDRVTGGQTPLFAIDHVKLEQAVEMERQALAVARCGKLEKQANLERVQAVLQKAVIDYQRQQKLLEEEKIGTQDQVEQLESGYLQAKANLKHAETLVALAGEQESQAETKLAMAEKDLRDATVLAPMDGTVSARYQEVGEMGAPGQPVFRIDSTDAVEISVYLPARHYGRVKVGETQMRVRVEGQDLGTFPVRYKGPTIDPVMRVFEVKCDLPPGVEGPAPGGLASVGVVLGEVRGLAVPAGSVGRRQEDRVVFRVEEGRARVQPIESGLESEGWIEVRQSGLAAGDRVVEEGRFLVGDGDGVRVLGGGSE